MSAVLTLGSCSSEEPEKKKTNVSVEQSEGQYGTYNVEMGKPFEAVRSTYNDQSKANVTISNFRIESDLNAEAEQNEKYDYAVFDAVVESTGDEINDDFMQEVSFTFYDENGKEIESYALRETQKVTFEPADLRPNGKNEGTFALAIPKGSVPKEILFDTNWTSATGNTYKYVMLITE